MSQPPPDISVIGIFHREGALALSAIASIVDLVDTARKSDLSVEAIAVLDNADETTQRIVATRGASLWNEVKSVNFGDLGLSRNAGAGASRGRYLSFLDGDDLWGADWLRASFLSATNGPSNAIWHPEYVYYFDESDFRSHSISQTPHFKAQSFIMRHRSNRDKDFDRRALVLENVWTANVFAARDIYINSPYLAEDRTRGFGVEDWSWNISTELQGVPHLIVPDTVHLVRVKQAGSLGKQITSEGKLPFFPANAAHSIFPESWEWPSDVETEGG